MQPLKEFVITVLKGVAIVLILLTLLFAPELPDLIPAPHWLNAVLDIAVGLATLQVFKWIIERPDKRATLQDSSNNQKTNDRRSRPERHVITIRKAHPQDATAIAACLASAFAPFRSQYTAGALADTVLNTEGVLDRMAHMTIYAAVTPAGEIVGTIATAVAVADQVGHLRGMAVRPDWQGRAIAEQLLLVAENDLQTVGCRRITLNTTAPLLRAIRFYERNGYTPSGEVPDFFGMPLHEYVKQLRPA